MTEQNNPNIVQRVRENSRPLDALDRKILGVLAQSADQSYADLSKIVGLSAPAIHERVKRLKAAGAIQKTVALIDSRSIGKPLLAFIHVATTGWGETRELIDMKRYPELEEIHSVAGDVGIILKVRLESSDALESFLKKLYELPNVVSTRSYVVLSTYLERPTQAGISHQLARKELTSAEL